VVATGTGAVGGAVGGAVVAFGWDVDPLPPHDSSIAVAINTAVTTTAARRELTRQFYALNADR
jgi:tartrate dehydratase alpha subunit/fumarate hydratase class I-like protein